MKISSSVLIYAPVSESVSESPLSESTLAQGMMALVAIDKWNNVSNFLAKAIHVPDS